MFQWFRQNKSAAGHFITSHFQHWNSTQSYTHPYTFKYVLTKQTDAQRTRELSLTATCVMNDSDSTWHKKTCQEINGKKHKTTDEMKEHSANTQVSISSSNCCSGLLEEKGHLRLGCSWGRFISLCYKWRLARNPGTQHEWAEPEPHKCETTMMLEH